MNYTTLDTKFLRNLLAHLSEVSPYQFYLEKASGRKIFEVNMAGSIVRVEDVDSALISLMFCAKKLSLDDDVRRFIQSYRDTKGKMLALTDISSLERLLRIGVTEKENQTEPLFDAMTKITRPRRNTQSRNNKGKSSHTYTAKNNYSKTSNTKNNYSKTSNNSFDALEKQLSEALEHLS